MEELILQFPAQMEQAWNQEINWQPDAMPRSISNVVVLGMGGSAFGAEVAKNLCHATCQVPFLVIRDYSLPGFVDTESLVVVSSYSGNTEETLSACKQALEKGIKPVVITSGGELMKLAGAHSLNLIQLPVGLPPRAAAGYSIIFLLRLLNHLGYFPEFSDELKNAIQNLKTQETREPAASLAKALKDRMIFLYSSQEFESVAIRWRQQIEENAKQIVSHHCIPEMNHNELVGWKHPQSVLKGAAVVMLRSSLDHPRNLLRMELNAKIIAEAGGKIFWVDAKGNDRLGQLMYLLQFGDWVSLFLARENEEDPTPVKVIDFLKNALASS